MIQDRAGVAMEYEMDKIEYEQKNTPKLSNCTIFNDLKRPVTHALRQFSHW